jgi:Caspase domain
MLTISCLKQAAVVQPHLIFKSMLRFFGLLLGLTVCCVFPAAAQPTKGSVYKDFLPMGSGASVALPEGAWEATQITSLDYPGTNWEVYTLKNQQPSAKVPFLVVRQTTTAGRWGNTTCMSRHPTQFMVNEHGTLSSQTLNKCSRAFAMNFDIWRPLGWANPNDKKWWAGAVEGMPEKLSTSRSSILMVELTVQQFNGKNLRIEAFVLPPKGMTAGKFRDDFKAGQVMPEHEILSGWTSIYIESMQQSYFNKKPQPIMALAYPVGTMDGTVMAQASTVTVPPVAQSVAPPKAEAELNRPVQVATPVAALPAPAVTTPKVEPVPVKPSPAPLVAAAPTPAPVVDNSAQLKLEQERKALDEEKRKMAQQLEAMTQMLAKLQQENAAAAAAAKAKELAAAAPAPEPVASKEPVTYANRKALVIGNDLYTHVPKLNNAGADADAMAKSLEAVGYKVFKHLNLNEKKFKQAVRDFRQNLTGGDEVLFFYAGHGVQLGNANYLLPIDVQGDQEDQVKDDAILLQKVLDDLEEKKTKFALAVIDACRDNPFKSKGRAIGGRGLAPTSAATGQMIMFSAGSGQQALDRLGDNDKEKNGLFTRIFVKEMTKPGLSVDRVLRNVRNEVVRLARSVGHEQTPALYDQAIGEFYFRQ